MTSTEAYSKNLQSEDLNNIYEEPHYTDLFDSSTPSCNTSDHQTVSSRERSYRLPRHINSSDRGTNQGTSGCTKKLLIGGIIGFVLALLVAVPVVYFVTKLSYKTDNLANVKVNVFQFDQSTLYKNWILSENGLTLSNTFSRATPVRSIENSNTLSKYRGVIGNKCLDRNSKIYFEVAYEFSVIGSFEPTDLIIEVGLAERDRVDNHHYVGGTETGGWAFYLNVCNTTDGNVCFKAQHNYKYAFDPVPCHQILVGSTYRGKFGFIVNTNRHKFSIVRNSKNDTTTVNSFENVYSAHRLCPVFGVYNSHEFEVKLTLSKTYDFSKTVWNTVMI